jgi:hypothetical protein
MAANALVPGDAFACVDRFRAHGRLRQDRRFDRGGWVRHPPQVYRRALSRGPASRPISQRHEAVPESRPAFGTRACFASLAPIKQPPIGGLHEADLRCRSRRPSRRRCHVDGHGRRPQEEGTLREEEVTRDIRRVPGRNRRRLGERGRCSMAPAFSFPPAPGPQPHAAQLTPPSGPPRARTSRGPVPRRRRTRAPRSPAAAGRPPPRCACAPPPRCRG